MNLRYTLLMLLLSLSALPTGCQTSKIQTGPEGQAVSSNEQLTGDTLFVWWSPVRANNPPDANIEYNVDTYFATEVFKRSPEGNWVHQATKPGAQFLTPQGIWSLTLTSKQVKHYDSFCTEDRKKLGIEEKCPIGTDNRDRYALKLEGTDKEYVIYEPKDSTEDNIYASLDLQGSYGDLVYYSICEVNIIIEAYSPVTCTFHALNLSTGATLTKADFPGEKDRKVLAEKVAQDVQKRAAKDKNYEVHEREPNGLVNVIARWSTTGEPQFKLYYGYDVLYFESDPEWSSMSAIYTEIVPPTWVDASLRKGFDTLPEAARKYCPENSVCGITNH